MSWLVRILPDLKRADVHRDLNDPDRMHKRLMMLVPDELGGHARSQAGVLFRVEDSRQGVQLLVQTLVKPGLARLPDGYGEIAVRELDKLLSLLTTGTRVHYRISANPSKRLGKSAGVNAGKIKALRGSAAEEWWTERAAANGLAVVTVSSQSQKDVRTRRGAQAGPIVRHAVVRFDGTGLVNDPKALREAALTGIGRAKTYGCGLLSLAIAR